MLEDLIIFIFAFLAGYLALRGQRHLNRVDFLKARFQSLQRQAKVDEAPRNKEFALKEALQKLKSWIYRYAQASGEDAMKEYRLMLDRVGWQSTNAFGAIIIGRLVTLGAGIFIYITLVTTVPVFENYSSFMKIVLFMIVGMLGFRGFDLFLNYLTHRRYKRIQQDLTMAINLLVVCANSGLTLERSLELAAVEIGLSNKVLGQEFALTAIELTILPDRRAALMNLASRINLPLIKNMVTTLVQSEEHGTAVAQSLRILANDFMKKTILDIEARASRLPALLSIPLILFILPSLFIIVMSPTIIDVMDTFNL